MSAQKITPRIDASKVVTAAEVSVGDMMKRPCDGVYRRILALTRSGDTVSVTYDNAVAFVFLEDDAVEMVTRRTTELGVQLYRVAHPLRPGRVAFVSIPEEEN